MKITKKYCPHCGYMYQRYTNHDKEWEVKSGCPIVTCPRCYQQFVDKDIKEPAFSNSPPKKPNILQILLTPLFPFGLGGAFFLFLSFKVDSELQTGALIFSLFALALYVYLVYIGIKNKDEIGEDLIYSYEQSKERLSDKKYVILLIDLGYPVPYLFLEKNYPDLLDYKRK